MHMWVFSNGGSGPTLTLILKSKYLRNPKIDLFDWLKLIWCQTLTLNENESIDDLYFFLSLIYLTSTRSKGRQAGRQARLVGETDAKPSLAPCDPLTKGCLLAS